MKRGVRAGGVCAIALALSGCASAALNSKLINVADTADYLNDPIRPVSLACTPRGPAEAEANRAALVTNDAPLRIDDGTPPDISGTDTHKKLLQIAQFANVQESGSTAAAATTRGPGGRSRLVLKIRQAGDTTLTHAELIDYFIKILNKGLATSSAKQAGIRRDWRRDPWEVWRRYYIAYVNEGFVARDGTALARFVASRNIGNEQIAALARIFLEGLFDSIYRTPVIVQGTRALDTGGPMPTAALLNVVPIEQALPDDERAARLCGITETKMRYIKAVASLDGESTALLSKALGEMFGSFTIGVGIGPNIKIGDADTVKTLVQVTSDTIIQAQRRALLYHFFSKFTYRRVAGGKGGPTRGRIEEGTSHLEATGDGEQARLARSVLDGLEAASAPRKVQPGAR